MSKWRYSAKLGAYDTLAFEYNKNTDEWSGYWLKGGEANYNLIGPTKKLEEAVFMAIAYIQPKQTYGYTEDFVLSRLGFLWKAPDGTCIIGTEDTIKNLTKQGKGTYRMVDPAELRDACLA